MHQIQMEENKNRKILCEEKKFEKRRSLIQKVETLGGMWQTGDHVCKKLAGIVVGSKKLDALKTPVNFHVAVLSSVIEKDLEQFSKNEVKLDVDQLSKNVDAILSKWQHLGIVSDVNTVADSPTAKKGMKRIRSQNEEACSFSR